MTNFIDLRTTLTGVDVFDVDISEVLFLNRDDAEYAIALNGNSGGISVYSVADNGTLTLVSARAFTEGTRDLATSQSVLTTIDGLDYVITGADQTGVYGYQISSSGTVGSAITLPATAGASQDVQAMIEVSREGDVMRFLVVTETGLIQLRSVSTDSSSLVGEETVNLVSAGAVSHVDLAQINGKTILLATDLTTSDIVSYALDIEEGGLIEVSRNGASEGIGMGTPTSFVQISVEGVNYVVVASSQSSSLTVYEINSEGVLSARDHVLDTAHTMFGAATMIESFEVNGISFFVAAGGDAGLNLFTLLPGGQLVMVETLVSGSDLMDLSSINVQSLDGDITLYLSSESNPGLMSLAFDTSAWGSVITGSTLDETVDGTDAGDIISGVSGNDILRGYDGDDIISDGTGEDNLYGGLGADVFVLTQDGDTDFIRDFEVGVDRLDLSGFSFFYSIYGVVSYHISGGIVLEVNDERIYIHSSSGDDLSVEDVLGVALETPDRPFLGNSTTYYGTSVNDTINGTDSDDVIYGGDGDDVIYGNDGNDLLIGGFGADRLHGDNGIDVIHGVFGNDILGGGNGSDILHGGSRDDRVYGGYGNDILNGGNGRDRLYGQAGDDRISGGAREDYLYGREGNDTLYGGFDNDVLLGGSGDDYAHGGPGNDRISGEDGDDVLSGQDGVDILLGGTGRDKLYGGAGNDDVDGEDGSDWLYGQDGHDTLLGGEGNDYIHGGNGNDALTGGIGNDIMSGNSGSDSFIFATSFEEDQIQDFNVSEDKIIFDIDGLTLSDISTSQAADGSLILTVSDANTILLNGVAFANYDDVDISFV